MSTPRKSPPGRSSGPRAERAPRQQPAQDLQPPATGGNRGSPAAPVMKQFAKTKAETSGKP